ncbi:MAG: MotA/TolQ/ExbB proton channel family protein [Phycisphaeraceae bacterium]|nr:MotA/TolQ/ExbB proton channel family protein [Phycisphaeraceae bacterium]
MRARWWIAGTTAVALAGSLLPAAAMDSGWGLLTLGQAQPPNMSFARMFLWRDTLIGLLVIQLLLLMSLTTVALIIHNLLRYRRSAVLPPTFYARMERLLAQKNYREAVATANAEPSLLGQLTKSALNESPRGFAAMEYAVEQAAEGLAGQMVRTLEYLNVMGNLGPMLGLFGTVYGMIVAFQELVAAGGRPDPGQLASGISTSLVTTFWGLVVAIPALAAHAMIRSKVESLAAEGAELAGRLIQPLRPAAPAGTAVLPEEPRNSVVPGGGNVPPG